MISDAHRQMQNSRLRPEAVSIYRERSQTRIGKRPNKMEKTARRTRTVFILNLRLTMRTISTKRKALTNHLVTTRFPICAEMCVSSSRVVPLTLTAPAIVIRRARASAESPFSPRSCIYILREGENGERKTTQKGETRSQNANGFHP